MILRIFILMCNHHHQSPEIFPAWKTEMPYPINSNSSFHLFSLSKILSVSFPYYRSSLDVAGMGSFFPIGSPTFNIQGFQNGLTGSYWVSNAGMTLMIQKWIRHCVVAVLRELTVWQETGKPTCDYNMVFWISRGVCVLALPLIGSVNTGRSGSSKTNRVHLATELDSLALLAQCANL